MGAIIISPTRELAKQIYDVAVPFLATVPGVTSMLLTGGTDPRIDVDKLMDTGAHVLVRFTVTLSHPCHFGKIYTDLTLLLQFLFLDWNSWTCGRHHEEVWPHRSEAVRGAGAR